MGMTHSLSLRNALLAGALLTSFATPTTAKADLIVWVNPNGTGQTPDQRGAGEWVDLLTDAGHTVVGQSIADVTTLSITERASLEAADLVIIGRLGQGTGTHIGRAPGEWNSISTAMLAIDPRTIDNHVSGWGWTTFPNGANRSVSGTIDVPDDRVFEGITDTGSVTYLTQQSRLASRTLLLGGTQLMTFSNYSNIARWEAENSGGVLAGDRMFFGAGTTTNNDDGVLVYNLNETGERLFLNTVARLTAVPEPSSAIMLLCGGVLILWARRPRGKLACSR